MATTREPGLDQAALTLDIDGDGVAWLVFDRPESKVNLLTAGVMMRLDGLLAELEERVRAGAVRALVIRSAKPGTFIAGADVNEIAGIDDPEEAAAQARRGQEVFRRIDRLPVPSVAVINGTCLGGGTELALACTYRLAADDKGTRIGLPEVRLGIIPGFGGTVRLPRVVGLQEGLGMILTGRTVSARKAGRIGLVDEVVPAPILERRAREFVQERLAEGPVRKRRRRGLAARLLEGTPPGRALVFRQARKQVLKETKGHYPAPLAALEVVRDTLTLPLDEALAREARAVGRLIAGDISKNLIHVFHLMEGAKKAGPEAEAREVKRAAVLGAGVMGGGIAQLLAYRGIPVRLKDIQSEPIGLALRHARQLFDKLVRRRKLSKGEATERMNEISPTLDYSGFGTADVVVEAVVERMDVKKQVLREAEQHVPTHCVLASNTSALSITEMQHALERPEHFCGMHFFNPVHRMPLVEIVRGAATSDEAIATIFELTRTLGKTPLLVNDGPGFLVNRLLAPYLNEAGWLLADGASIEAVDRALVRFGMPMGPFRLLDEVGLDVARHVAGIMYDAFGDRMRPAPTLRALEDTDRLGRKGGLGFYRYEDGREKEVDPAVYEALGPAVPTRRRDVPDDEIVERTVYVMINEAARALDDGIVARPEDVDLGLITGTGFPPFRGGLLRYADSVGLPRILRTLERLERDMDARFHPAPLLRKRVDEGRGFYAG